MRPSSSDQTPVCSNAIRAYLPAGTFSPARAIRSKTESISGCTGTETSRETAITRSLAAKWTALSAAMAPCSSSHRIHCGSALKNTSPDPLCEAWTASRDVASNENTKGVPPSLSHSSPILGKTSARLAAASTNKTESLACSTFRRISVDTVAFSCVGASSTIDQTAMRMVFLLSSQSENLLGSAQRALVFAL